MTRTTAETAEDELTIISHRLLRTPTKAWEEPTHLFKRLRGAALAEIITELHNPSAKAACYHRQRALLMFDCMLRVIDEPELNSVLELGTKRFAELQNIFYSALASDKFNALTPSSRIFIARSFYQLLTVLGKKFEIRFGTFIPNSNKTLPTELASVFDNTILNNDEVAKLQPFLLTPKAGEDYNVLLSPMVSQLGLPFTRRFLTVLRSIAVAKAKDTALRDFGTTFARFVKAQSSTDNPVTEASLKNPKLVYEMLVRFMTYHFMKKYSMDGGGQEGTLSSLQKLWTRYEQHWPKLASAGLVAAPRPGFPKGKPSLSNVTGVRHNRKRVRDESSSEGMPNHNSKSTPKAEFDSVTHKLLTPVPLHLSDEATTHLIFKQINEDFVTTQTWLDSHLEQMWQHYQRGLVLAGPGPYLISSDAKLVDLLNPKKNPDALAEALRYFKQRHKGYVDTLRVATRAYPEQVARGGVAKTQLGPLLGIPTRENAMALMGYLASVDGRFSESALAAAELFTRDGNRINAVNSGANTLTLSVLKERAGSSGWHDIVVSGRAYEHLQRWLVLTSPIRAYMKENQIPGWQNLIIYASNPLGKPAFYDRTSNINSAFRAFAKRSFATLGELAELVTIPRIRSQRGIIVFLKDFDIKAMARELGNDEETSMRHYLPDAIWNYFAVRWIRIFQNLLIVQAARGTPYMARALMFETATELDDFLKTHALKPLIEPEDDDDGSMGDSDTEDSAEEGLQAQPKVQELMVAASHEIFVTLLSVKGAVELAFAGVQDVHDKALYWYEFTKRLQGYIESDAFADRGIKKLLKNAAADAAPESYLKAIRA